MADLLQYIGVFNTFLTLDNEGLKFTMRSTDDLKDFGILNESRKREQMTKKSVVVGGSYRNCKSSE